MLVQDRQHHQRHANSEQRAASENKSSDRVEMQLQAERTAELLRQRSSRLLIKRSRCGDLGAPAKKLLQLVSKRIQPPGFVAES